MSIQFACQCGKTLRAAKEHAGKRAKCNKCGQIVTIPAAQQAVAQVAPKPVSQSVPTAKKAVSQQTPKAVSVSASEPASGFDVDDFFSSEIPLAQPTAATLNLTPAVAPVRSNPARACPSCKKPLSHAAVLCVNCGYNLNTGQRTNTFAYKPSTYEETEKAPKKKRPSFVGSFIKSRLTSGKFMSGLAMMIGAAVWFFLGLSMGRLFLYPPVLFLIGAFSFINGLIDGGDN